MLRDFSPPRTLGGGELQFKALKLPAMQHRKDPVDLVGLTAEQRGFFTLQSARWSQTLEAMRKQEERLKKAKAEVAKQKRRERQRLERRLHAGKPGGRGSMSARRQSSRSPTGRTRSKSPAEGGSHSAASPGASPSRSGSPHAGGGARSPGWSRLRETRGLAARLKRLGAGGEAEQGSGSAENQEDGDQGENEIARRFLEILAPPKTSLDDRMGKIKRFGKMKMKERRDNRLRVERKAQYDEMPTAEREALRRCFLTYDRDDSGTLERKEVRDCLAEMGLWGKTMDEKREVLHLIDEVVGEEEEDLDFYAFSVELVPKVRAKLKDVARSKLFNLFSQYDSDGSGALGRDECFAVLRQQFNIDTFDPMHSEYVAQLFEQCDTDRGNELQFDEYQSFIVLVKEEHARHVRMKEQQVRAQFELSDAEFKAYRHELLQLLDTFNRYDVDHSMQLDMEEIKSLLTDNGIFPRSKDQVEKVFKMLHALDTDGDGLFDFREFLELVGKVREASLEMRRAELRQVFNHYDKDRSGNLSSRELVPVLCDVGITASSKKEQDEIKAILLDVDEDGSGEIDFEEFMTLIQRASERLTSLKRIDEAEHARKLGFNTEKLTEFRSVFDALDEDNSRFLEIGELRYAMTLLGKRISSESLRALFKQIDKDGSGHLDFFEFLELMQMVEEQKGIFNKEPEPVSTIDKLPELAVREALEYFPLSKDYVRSLPREQMVEVLCSYMELSKDVSLGEALGVQVMDELMAKCQETAEKLAPRGKKGKRTRSPDGAKSPRSKSPTGVKSPGASGGAPRSPGPRGNSPQPGGARSPRARSPAPGSPGGPGGSPRRRQVRGK